ncbi:MAG: tetratricopeptide repeat protein [Chloroflexi bacterium]|nr:tetratricopeptide repeat protein [Chloroflexota bacterium]
MNISDELRAQIQRKDFFRDMLAVLTVVATMLGAAVTYAEVGASTHSDRAARRSQIYAIQAMGARLQATQRNIFDVNVYATSNELNIRAMDAQDRSQAIGRVPGMASSTAQYNNAAARWLDLRDQIRALSPLLSDMHFQAGKDAVRFDQYFEESLVVARGKSERQRAYGEEGDAWGRKDRHYLSIITLLAVTLFLYGLSLTIPGSVRAILMGVGMTIMVICAGWAFFIYTIQVPQTSDAAIQAYLNGLTALNNKEYQQAIADFNQALVLDKNFRAVWADRGYAYSFLEDPASIKQAIGDFEHAISLGDDNTYTRRNLARLYVEQRQYNQAEKNFRVALKQDPNQASLYFDLGLALLVSDRRPLALQSYRQGIEVLSKQPGYIRDATIAAAIGDLQDARMMGNSMVAGPALVRLLKEATASMLMMGQMEPKDTAAQIGAVLLTVDETGISAAFDYRGMQDGYHWLDRWYLDGKLQLQLSSSRPPWADGLQGTKVIHTTEQARLRPGTYRVEIYVEGKLLQSGQTTFGSSAMMTIATMMNAGNRYTNTRLGISLPRPPRWQLVGGGDDSDFVAFANREGQAFLILTAKQYDAASPTEANNKAVVEELEGQKIIHPDLKVITGTETLPVGGIEGAATGYTYKGGENQMRGIIVAVTRTGKTYRIRFEAAAQAFDDYRKAFGMLLGHLEFK